DRLLRAALDAPDDDAPRLIYADWLQQRGDPRGEFIALQLANKPRADALLAKHKKDWIGRFVGTRTRYGTEARQWTRGSPTKWEFARGFVHGVTMSSQDFLRYAEELFAVEPVASVHLTDRGFTALCGRDI